MGAQAKSLLVEGNADVLFYTACCRVAGINDVWVGPPTEFDGLATGKGNAIAIFSSLVDGMADGRVLSLGIIVDADYAKSGLGYVKTFERISKILNDNGFLLDPSIAKTDSGLIYKSSDGLPDVGLWIMPKRGASGFLEDFIAQSLVKAELKLYKEARDKVASLDQPKFKDIHLSKAEIATWLAWQKIPGQGFHGVVGAKLVDFKSGIAKEFIDWLKKLYL